MRPELALKFQIDRLMNIDKSRATPEHEFSWSFENYQSELLHDHSHVFEWFQNAHTKELGGFVISRQGIDGECEIMHLACALPGCGLVMMQAWLEWAKSKKIQKIFLEFHHQNQRAQKLYTALGFEQDARRLRYYQDGGDAILMSLKI